MPSCSRNNNSAQSVLLPIIFGSGLLLCEEKNSFKKHLKHKSCYNKNDRKKIITEKIYKNK